MKDVEYIPGGATQNSIRVAQWVLQSAGATSYFGCIGSDDFGSKMRENATKDGINVRSRLCASHMQMTAASVAFHAGQHTRQWSRLMLLAPPPL